MISDSLRFIHKPWYVPLTIPAVNFNLSGTGCQNLSLRGMQWSSLRGHLFVAVKGGKK